MPNTTTVTKFTWNEMPRERVTNRIDRRIVCGEHTMVAHVYLQKGAVVPEHSQSSSPTSWGKLRFWVGDDFEVFDVGKATTTRQLTYVDPLEGQARAETPGSPRSGCGATTVQRARGIAASNRKLGVEFVAEDIGAYKPADVLHLPSNVPHKAGQLRIPARPPEVGSLDRSDILHTAQSLHHDHEPANRFGLANAWIDRRKLARSGSRRPPPISCSLGDMARSGLCLMIPADQPAHAELADRLHGSVLQCAEPWQPHGWVADL